MVDSELICGGARMTSMMVRTIGLSNMRKVLMSIKDSPKDDSLIRDLTEVTYDGIRERTPRVGFGKGWSTDNNLYENTHRVVITNTSGIVFTDVPYSVTVETGHASTIRAKDGIYLKFAKKGIPREFRDVIIAPGTSFTQSPVIFTEAVKGQEGSHMFEYGILDTFEDRERILDKHMTDIMEGKK